MRGFADGGYTGDYGTKSIAGYVHGQEYVVNAPATRRNRSFLDLINAGRQPQASNVVNLAVHQAPAARAASPAPSPGPTINVTNNFVASGKMVDRRSQNQMADRAARNFERAARMK
jgi:hypothetical protein